VFWYTLFTSNNLDITNLGFVLLPEEEEKAWEKSIVFSLDLKTATESLLRTVFSSEFQTANAEH